MATMNMSENFCEKDEILFGAQFSENKTKTLPQNFTNFRKIIDELSVNCRQTDGDSYLNKNSRPTLLIDSKSNMALDGPRISQSNCEVVSNYTIKETL